ncbi:MAG: trimeric autotransporter adhesin, partial [Bacteroidota bacterium]|nr:trimeric autotransporter adhesin [Bacteroidota bacterium]
GSYGAFTSPASAKMKFMGANNQKIQGNSTYHNMPVNFGRLEVESGDTVDIDINANVIDGGELTLTKGVLNLGTKEFPVGGIVTRKTGTIDASQGTYRSQPNHSCAVFDDKLFGGSDTTAGSLLNLYVSSIINLSGNLTIKGNLTLDEDIDYTGNELTVKGNVTRSGVGWMFIHGNTGTLILDSTGTFEELSNDWFYNFRVHNLVLKRHEVMTGNLEVTGYITINTGVSYFDIGTYELKLSGTTSSINRASGAILANSLSSVTLPSQVNVIPANIFVNNECGNLTTYGETILGGDLTINGILTQTGGPFNIYTGKNNTLIFSETAIIYPDFVFNENGHVVGNMRRTVTSAETTFHLGGGTANTYHPVTLKFESIGTRQNVKISSETIDPTYNRGGMPQYAINALWNIQAEGVSPWDNMRIKFSWYSEAESITPDSLNSAFSAQWNGTYWRSYSSSYNNFNIMNPRTLDMDARTYPIQKDSLSGVWAVFITDNSSQAKKDSVISTKYNKIVITKITPNPTMSGSAITATVELQNQYGEPLKVSGSPMYLKVVKESGLGTFSAPSNIKIPIGKYSTDIKGITITNTGGETDFQIRIDTLSTGKKDVWIPAISPSITILGREPTAQATDIKFRNVKTTELDMEWASTGNVIVLGRADSGVVEVPADGKTYYANQLFGAGSNIGGSAVIYSGPGTSCKVFGLSPNTQYYFRVFAFSGTFSTENYNTQIAANNPLAVRTRGGTDDDISIGDNDTWEQAKPIGTNTPVFGRLNQKGDIDWYCFTLTNATPNLRIKLSELPDNYEMELYDLNLKKIRKCKLPDKKVEGATINGMPAGTYLLKIYPGEGVGPYENPYLLYIMTRKTEIYSVTP